MQNGQTEHLQTIRGQVCETGNGLNCEQDKEEDTSKESDACFGEEYVRDSLISERSKFDIWHDAATTVQLAGKTPSSWPGGIVDTDTEKSNVERAENSLLIEKKKRTVSTAPSRIRKRKRRTNLEILQTFCGSVAVEDSIEEIPKRRQIISYNFKQKRKRKDAKKEHRQCSKIGFFPDNYSLDPSSKQSHQQHEHGSILIPEGEAFDKTEVQSINLPLRSLDGDKPNGEKAKRALDNNNNEVEVTREPCSPTLVLKRSVNNEWRIAKSSLARYRLENEEQGRISANDPEAEDSLQKAESIHVCTTSRNISSKARAFFKKAKRSAGSKVKQNEAVKQGCSTKRSHGNGTLSASKKSEAKSTSRSQVTNTEVANNSSKLNQSRSPLPAKPKGRKLKQKLVNDSTINKAKEGEDMIIKVEKESLDAPEKSTVKINKGTDDGIRKRRRARRVQLNTFRLIETIPYQSFLMVKDGDLCPTDSLAYSSAKRVPGCCHPLWRWHLGKPVPIPKQPKSTCPGEQPCKEVGESEYLIGLRGDEVEASSKESTDSQM